MNEQTIIQRWLQNEVGCVWTKETLPQEFELIECKPQYAVARHRISGKLGSLWRTRDGMYYHSFAEDSAI